MSFYQLLFVPVVSLHNRWQHSQTKPQVGPSAPHVLSVLGGCRCERILNQAVHRSPSLTVQFRYPRCICSACTHRNPMLLELFHKVRQVIQRLGRCLNNSGCIVGRKARGKQLDIGLTWHCIGFVHFAPHTGKCLRASPCVHIQPFSQ